MFLLPDLRDARDTDAEGLIALIGSVFAEYPGCLLDVEGEIPELLRIASAFAELHGEFWVAERDGRVVGCVGYAPAHDPGGIELKKLYVARTERQHGLGAALLDLVVEAGVRHRARFIDLWSDTRFETAHRFYERRAFKRGPHTRELHDSSDTVEYYYRREL